MSSTGSAAPRAWHPAGLGGAEQRLAAPQRAARQEEQEQRRRRRRRPAQVARDHRDRAAAASASEAATPGEAGARRSCRRCRRGDARDRGLEAGRAGGDVLLRDAEVAPARPWRRRADPGRTPGCRRRAGPACAAAGAAKAIDDEQVRRRAAGQGRVGDGLVDAVRLVALRVRVVRRAAGRRAAGVAGDVRGRAGGAGRGRAAALERLVLGRLLQTARPSPVGDFFCRLVEVEPRVDRDEACAGAEQRVEDLLGASTRAGASSCDSVASLRPAASPMPPFGRAQRRAAPRR